jgi:hypothetical protein
MLELICWVGVGLAIISAAAMISFVCHEEADERREHHRNKHRGPL